MLVRHALHRKRNVRSIADYRVARLRMGRVVITLSFYATFMRTNTLIGAGGKSWNYGLSWWVGGVVLTALAATSWFVVAPRFVPLTKKHNSPTVADFVGFHYDSQSVRRVAAAMSYPLAVGVKYLVEPRQVSRMYGLRDAKAMRTASIIAPVAILVT